MIPFRLVIYKPFYTLSYEKQFLIQLRTVKETVAKVLYRYLQFFKPIIFIENFWRQLFQLIIGQVTKKEQMS